MEIVIPTQNRRWQREMLHGLFDKRLAVVVAHRRAGKTEAVCARLLMAAMKLSRSHPAPFFGYLAPFLNQARAVAWERLKFYARQLPGTIVNESEPAIKLLNGSTIRLFGADYPDRLRGLGFDGVAIDEVAQMRPETWPAVVRPALADRNGWAVFIGTPKGQNIFYDLYQNALNDPDKWYAGFFPADKTGVLRQLELDKLKEEMGNDLFRQEFLCDFTASNNNSFIEFTAIREAMFLSPPSYNPAPLVFGLDPARFGDDRTVLVQRRGLVLEDIAIWRGQDLMSTAARVAEAANTLKPRLIFVDAVGLGAGVLDRLKQLGYRVAGVNSGGRPALPARYANLKAEMWSRMRQWLLEGASIPDSQELMADLLAPAYDYDPAGKLRIESKVSLKSRGLPSPDCADALALTFAWPVATEARRADRLEVAQGVDE